MLTALKRIRHLLTKEIAQLRRDPRIFGILIVAPVIQLVVMGNATTTDVRNIRLAVRDNDRSFHSREFVRALNSSGYFQSTTLSGPETTDGARLVSGESAIVLIIPPDFSRELLQGKPAPVQLLVDGSDSNFAVQGMNYIQKAARQYSEAVQRRGNSGQTSSATSANQQPIKLPSVTGQIRVWFNPNLLSPHYLVPAIMALILMVTTMIVTSMALVKEREEGTLEQLIVTPLRPLEIIAGKLLPFVVIGFVVISIALPVIVFGFGIRFRGSLGVLFGFSGVFLLNTLGLGLFISTLARTQQQAMMIATFFVMMPFVLLSGFAFPVENIPFPIRAVSEIIPLKHFLVALRSVFLKGAGFTELWLEAVVLLAWGIGILGLAALRFRKRLD